MIALRPAILAALALLAACGSGGDRQGVGGVTADEAAQLNDAAQMLDAAPNAQDASPIANGGG